MQAHRFCVSLNSRLENNGKKEEEGYSREQPDAQVGVLRCRKTTSRCFTTPSHSLSTSRSLVLSSRESCGHLGFEGTHGGKVARCPKQIHSSLLMCPESPDTQKSRRLVLSFSLHASHAVSSSCFTGHSSYRGTSPIRNCPPPYDHRRALRRGLR